MPLSAEHHGLLVGGLRLSHYDGLTQDEARAYLNDPRTETESVPTRRRLNAIGLIDVLGVQSAMALSTALKAVLGDFYGPVMEQGVDLSHPESRATLQALAQAQPSLEASIETLLSLGFEERTTTHHPRLMDAFPYVKGEPFPAAGFPNRVEEADFAAAWQEARS